MGLQARILLDRVIRVLAVPAFYQVIGGFADHIFIFDFTTEPMGGVDGGFQVLIRQVADAKRAVQGDVQGKGPQ